jgi:Protein of unknown function (DUF3667)
MSGEFEAAGAAATAGLAAGVIEGKTGAGAAQKGFCPNCGGALDGAYCQACGQPAHISRTLADVLGDFLHAFFHYDTKAWRTLPLLVGRPGTLTHRYIHGQRARYVSPLAMFLFAVFIMFFVFSMVGGPEFLRAEIGDEAQSESTLTVAEAEAALVGARERRDAARAALAAAEIEAEKVRNDGRPGAGGRATGLIAEPRAKARVAETAAVRAQTRLDRAKAQAVEREKALAEASVELGAAKTEIEQAAPAAGAVVGAAKEAVDAGADRKVVGIEVKDGAVIATDDEDGGDWRERLREAVLNGEIKTNSGSPQTDQKVRAALLNPDLALYKLQETASKFSFLLVPISLPFIALLFLWKRGVTFFDHVVFSLYSLSFMSLLFVALALVARAGEWTLPFVGVVACIAPPVHMFFHLGGTYKLGWWSALWRTSFLLFFIIFVVIIFALSILALGLLS